MDASDDSAALAGQGGLLARLTMARKQLSVDEHAAALETARETARMYPDLAEAALGLGEVLLALEALPAAIAELQRALRIDPALDDARFMLGRAWLAAGEAQRALDAFAELPDDHAGLAEALAAAEALRAAPRSPPGYVRHLFDQFAVEYDRRMVGELRYRAPGHLRGLFDMIAPQSRGLTVLDLGCGTGLSGAAFRDLAARLDGVDLSPQMLERAGARRIYESLRCADVEAPPPASDYDLVIAADTLVYLGDLAAVFAAAKAALKPGGLFLFTLERADGDGFELGPKRRWRHGEAYVRAAAAAAGLDVAGLLACVPRFEKGQEVPGLATALRR